MLGVAGGDLSLSETRWRSLNWLWIAFFVVMGTLNLFVFRNFDENTWVNFKAWGMLGLTLVFIVVQGFWIASRTQGHDGSTG
jgi:intracellular septation protein